MDPGGDVVRRSVGERLAGGGRGALQGPATAGDASMLQRPSRAELLPLSRVTPLNDVEAIGSTTVGLGEEERRVHQVVRSLMQSATPATGPARRTPAHGADHPGPLKSSSETTASSRIAFREPPFLGLDATAATPRLLAGWRRVTTRFVISCVAWRRASVVPQVAIRTHRASALLTKGHGRQSIFST